MASPKSKLSLSVQYACTEGAPPRPFVRRCAQASLERPAEATVRFVDAQEGQALNRDFRGKDYATNVLSFPYETAPVAIGDLAICLPVVLREAAEQSKPPEAHFAHLIVHGMLDLQGYDHETGDADRASRPSRQQTWRKESPATW